MKKVVIAINTIEILFWQVWWCLQHSKSPSKLRTSCATVCIHQILLSNHNFSSIWIWQRIFSIPSFLDILPITSIPTSFHSFPFQMLFLVKKDVFLCFSSACYESAININVHLKNPSFIHSIFWWWKQQYQYFGLFMQQEKA